MLDAIGSLLRSSGKGRGLLREALKNDYFNLDKCQNWEEGLEGTVLYLVQSI